ncbi:MAG TPA: hypothetical protein VEA15_06210 [Caulobacteraceae bacterium]|nr:hypothetical protein [Caulobacteraceae bacterium]
MNVELAEERVLFHPDRFNMDHAEGRAWSKRLEAFGTLAKMSSFLNKPRDEDFELVYRERRYQPYWHVCCAATYAYERRRAYEVPVAPEVRSVSIEGRDHQAANGRLTLEGLETCREEMRREALFDGVSKAMDSSLHGYLRYDSQIVPADEAAGFAPEGVIVVPPQAKASMLLRDVLAGVINRIDADRVLEETVRVEAIDLYYRPVYAFRYRWQGKEAVIEFDALTGEARPGGATFEQYLGKVLEPKFLLDVGAETIDIFIPGANLAKLVIEKAVQASAARKAQ